MKNFLLLVFLTMILDAPTYAMEDSVVVWGGVGSRTKARRGSWVDTRSVQEQRDKMMELVRRGSQSVGRREDEATTHIISLPPKAIAQLQAFLRDHNISKVSRTEVSPFWNAVVSRLTCCCKEGRPSSERGCCSRFIGKLRGLVHPGLEYFALGIFPGWAWMAGKFRIWGFVVYPGVFDIHDESGKPLAFNYKDYSVPESLFIGSNYWFSVAYLMILSGKIIHKALVRPCCAPRTGYSCCSKRQYPLVVRTNRAGHRLANMINFGLTLAVVSPELVLYGRTLKTGADWLRHGVSMPLYAGAEGAEIFYQQKLSTDAAVNRLYDRGKGQVVEDRALLGHFLRSACNAIQFGFGDGEVLPEDLRVRLYDALFLFKGSARSRISGPIDHREWRGAISVLLKLFFIGQKRDLTHEISRLLEESRANRVEGDEEASVEYVFPDTPEGRYQQTRKEFLDQALKVLQINENLHWAHQVLEVHASFKGPQTQFPQRNEEIGKLSFLRSSAEASPDMTNETTAAGYLVAISTDHRKEVAALNRLRDDLGGRRRAKEERTLVRTPQEQRWRRFMSAHSEEPTEAALRRTRWTAPIGAALGFLTAKVMVKGFVGDLMTSFGADPEAAESVSEPLGWVAAIPGTYFGARLFNAVTKPVDVLESGLRSTLRGVARLGNIVGLPAAYFGYKQTSATAMRGIGNLVGEGSGNTADPYALYTLQGVHPRPVYASVNGSTVLVNPNLHELYTRGQIAGSIVPAVPMALLTARLGWRMFTDQVLHMHDSWTGYRYYRDTNDFNPHAYATLKGEFGWVAFNAFAGSWWALTFLSGVFKPGLEAAGASPATIWASSTAALLARGSYEGKIVERHWLDLAAFFAKKHRFFRGGASKASARSAVRDAKLLILMHEMIHFLEVDAPDSLINNLSHWLKTS